MINYSDNAAKYVTQGALNLTTSAWTPLRVGSSNLNNRTSIRLFPRSNPGMTVALAYAVRDGDGNFTAPTDYIGNTTVIPGGRIWTEPLSDKVTIYGRVLLKGGATDSSIKIIVTEFA